MLVVSRDVQPKSWPGLTCSSIHSSWQDYYPQWHSRAVWVMSLKSVTAQSGTKCFSCTSSCMWGKLSRQQSSLSLLFSIPPSPQRRSFSSFLLLHLVRRANIPMMLSADLSQDWLMKVNNQKKSEGWNLRYIWAQHSLWGKGTGTNLTVPCDDCRKRQAGLEGKYSCLPP